MNPKTMAVHRKSENGDHTNLTGTYTVKLDIKRVKIPKPMITSLLILNDGERKLYLKLNKDKIIGYTLLALDKLRKELGDLPLLNPGTINKMEALGASLHETNIMGNDKITIPDEMMAALNIRTNSDVKIKGAFEVITISKNKLPRRRAR